MADILAKVARAPTWQKAAAILGASYAGWKMVDGKYNLSADLELLPKMMALASTLRFLKEPGAGVVKLWYRTLKEPGQLDKNMFISADTGKAYTFRDVEELSNKVANWALSQGMKPGDTVALMMDNCPEYVPVWLGLAKVRCVASLINTNQKGKPLIHAITISNAKVAIFGSEHAAAAGDVMPEVRGAGISTVLCYSRGGGGSLPEFCDASFDGLLEAQPSTPVDESIWMASNAAEPCCYIYTSGTTGLPKACKVSNARMMNYGVMMQILGIGSSDVIYGSGLPLYHTAANLGTLATIRSGSTLVIRSKFSATNFWDDCAKHKVTATQYIGELCRYLLAAPPKPAERQHGVRISVGNGLRPEIWNEYQRRFGIAEIGEFYGATEGNVGLFNHCKNYEGQGAIGRAGPLLKMIRPSTIVKFDVENEEPVRGPDGFCIPCAYNEPGELLGPIREIATAQGSVPDFDGYTNDEASQKKILRDVFKKGDQYFRTGDLIRLDAKGYYYFVDRIGDTFRWKGENVSTMEVSEVLSAFPGVVDANVFGVEVPGKDGRACMVAMTLDAGVDLDAEKFTTYCRANLPSYSMPVFIRFLTQDINLTGTFKHQKVEYRSEGCDPGRVKDKMWWLNAAAGRYEPYGLEQYAEITGGRAKL